MAEIEPEASLDTKGMSTDDLVARALNEVARQDDGPVPYLLALHARPTREVYAAAVRLLHSEVSMERELGARVLRELGPNDAEARPFAREARRALIERLRVESSPRVIGWIISALDYNGATEELSTILSLARHDDAFVRFHVAAAIPSLVGASSGAEAVSVIEEMVTDPDADVRFYAAYALLEEMVGVSKQRKRDIAGNLVNDEDEQIRNFAQSWTAESSENPGCTQ